jgi:CO/xanthine dehydrogenase Mo-binding subunit
MPAIEIEHLASPPQGPIDFRGVGETGAIGAPAALTNAIEDALAWFLAPAPVRVTHEHCSPERILALVRRHSTPRQHRADRGRVRACWCRATRRCGRRR